MMRLCLVPVLSLFCCGSVANAGSFTPFDELPENIQLCAGMLGYDGGFAEDISGFRDFFAQGERSCAYQSEFVWYALDCQTGQRIEAVVFRSQPTEWSTFPAVDAHEAWSDFRAEMVVSPVSLHEMVGRLREMGADVSVTERTNYAEECARNEETQ